MGYEPLVPDAVSAIEAADPLNLTGNIFIADGKGLVIGHTAQLTISNGDGDTDLIPELQIIGTAKADSSVLYAAFSLTATRAAAPSVALAKGGAATVVVGTVVTNGEVLGTIIAYGDDGTDLEAPAASIEFEVDGTPGTGDMPGKILFYTSVDAGEVLTERLSIDAVGQIKVASAVDATSSITGSVITAGGLGVLKDAFFGNDVIVENGGGMIIGDTVRQTVAAVTAETQIIGEATADSSLTLVRFNVDNNGPRIQFAHSRAASSTAFASTPVKVEDGDIIGDIFFVGDDAVDFATGMARILVQADGETGNNDLPARMTFSTTADGASSITERLRIDKQGTLLVGGSASAGSGAARAMVFFNGAPETTQTAGSALIFAKDVTTVATMHSQDEAETIVAF